MDEIFELPVTYKGEDFSFPAKLLKAGYGHKFEVEIAGYPVIFELDEEECYRALIDPDLLKNSKEIEIGLLREVAEVIDYITGRKQ
ncbi:hypothetical protein QNI19_13380 [Cytophagaceae bacterium DM2B3-1]|uniref:Uncharacterized protein n=1 Tax=Xanthocytophaga flava TaxID=3048013 RepID=A0ABT7CMM3_9BACT|nr:hypothetical protein [Xanthocytophaga flavus]MDJ1467851.1 hypothetical protein [Xanthocytophaga flavus]MDJ1493929.1 hypothetical protein [Xanthocytophaga flavus]